MASFVSGSCRYLAWEDAKRSAKETNNNAIILADHYVPCSLSVTSSHKTLAFYARKSRGLYWAESDFYFLNLEQKSLSFCDTSSKEGNNIYCKLKAWPQLCKYSMCLKVSERNQNLAWLDAILRNFPAQNKHRKANPKLRRESSSAFWPLRNS